MNYRENHKIIYTRNTIGYYIVITTLKGLEHRFFRTSKGVNDFHNSIDLEDDFILEVSDIGPMLAEDDITVTWKEV